MRTIALFSTFNKEGISSIARALSDQNYEIVATGKTRLELESAGIKVLDISDLTGEPERFGGRVKTLNHKVLGGILFRPGQDEGEWPYDFRVGAVICNFYPFQEKAAACKTLGELSEWIDIGGPTMVRAAAKNCKHVWVFTRPEQYIRFIASPERDDNLKARFALEAFEDVAELDDSITFHHQLIQPWSGGGELNYGENPHQKARFLPNRKMGPKFYGNFSYNNVRDAETAFRFVMPFQTPAVGVVKHQTLCGASVGLKNASEDAVFEWAWEGDAVSRYGGIIAMNFVPSPTITTLLSKKFVELLVLPRTVESEEWASDFLKANSRYKILLVAHDRFGRRNTDLEGHSGVLGRLVQDCDWVDVTGADLSMEALELAFGTWASANTKSNAMVLTGFDERTRAAYLAGAGQGQPNRIDALKLLAIPRAEDFCERRKVALEQLSCFSDAFLPFDDCIHVLHEAGVKRLFQPGGSKKDAEVADTANKLGVKMVLTKKRHFWH